MYDVQRIINISNCNVSFLNFKLGRQKIQELIDSGQAATRSFFLSQEERLSRLKTFESGIQDVNYHPPTPLTFYKMYKNTRSSKLLLGVEIIGDNINFHTDYTCSFAPLKNTNRDQFSFFRLAKVDARFSIFTHLRKGELDKAEKIYETHQSFFKKCFFWNVFREIVIEENCEAYVTFFMSKGFSFSTSTFDPLWYAYHCKAFKSFCALLKDPNIDLRITEEKTSKTLLYYIAKEGRLELAQLFCHTFSERYPKKYKQLLDHEVNSSVGIKKTAFVIALEKKNFEVARFLIEEGADYLKFGLPLLYNKYKCCCNNMNARYFLFTVLSGDIKRGLSPGEKIRSLRFCLTYSSYGGDPEHEHLANEWSDGERDIWRYTTAVGIEFAKKLIQNKIINSPIEYPQEFEGESLLFIIMANLYMVDATEELINLLLTGKYTDHINRANNRGETLLILLAKYSIEGGRANCARILQTLLGFENIDINHQDNTGNTALHYAVSMGKGRAKLLLGHKEINPNIRNNRGQTPFHLTHDKEVIELLKQVGGDDDIKDHKGKSAEEVRRSLVKPKYESAIGHVVSGIYKDIHESDMPIEMKIFTGSLITIMQPIMAPFLAGVDAYYVIKHSTTDGFCKCASCERQRNAHKPN